MGYTEIENSNHIQHSGPGGPDSDYTLSWDVEFLMTPTLEAEFREGLSSRQLDE